MRIGKDPATGQWEQITKRGFRTAAEAGQARRELAEKVDRGELKAAMGATTVSELLDIYLDGLDADEHLSAKTRYDYRHSANDYVRPYLGHLRVRDITPETILSWQRTLTKEGATKHKVGANGQRLPGKGLSPNTVRLARSPLAGAFKLAV
ncbi:MAG: tyrosine-type recombinase/integrase [Acidimicrobiales bacterium]